MKRRPTLKQLLSFEHYSPMHATQSEDIPGSPYNTCTVQMKSQNASVIYK